MKENRKWWGNFLQEKLTLMLNLKVENVSFFLCYGSSEAALIRSCLDDGLSGRNKRGCSFVFSLRGRHEAGDQKGNGAFVFFVFSLKTKQTRSERGEEKVFVDSRAAWTSGSERKTCKERKICKDENFQVDF